MCYSSPYEKNSVGTVNMGDVIMEEMIVDLMKVVCKRPKLGISMDI